MELSQLAVQKGFRMRGEAATRRETLVDASFARVVPIYGAVIGKQVDALGLQGDAAATP